MLRLLNLMWLPKPAGRVTAPGPGFPSLEELCLAGSTCNFVSDEALGRLLHGSPSLRLLDLRGCARITPAGLCDLPCQGQLPLGAGQVGRVWFPLPAPQLMNTLCLQNYNSFTWASMACPTGLLWPKRAATC